MNTCYELLIDPNPCCNETIQKVLENRLRVVSSDFNATPLRQCFGAEQSRLCHSYICSFIQSARIFQVKMHNSM
ncbi:hypothetical protein KC19_4G141400 [Ceratodon purpureus]|uniref:Uncharacterized protein n=1 Tax=Ceratodon purpureus TaxID=3225 RepID=A0A8T0IAH7_CERPU|nr:hypothetical protein KC19_4G141400 [Ceratodon purpureus]